jgi:hypothetical protein
MPVSYPFKADHPRDLITHAGKKWDTFYQSGKCVAYQLASTNPDLHDGVIIRAGQKWDTFYQNGKCIGGQLSATQEPSQRGLIVRIGMKWETFYKNGEYIGRRPSKVESGNDPDSPTIKSILDMHRAAMNQHKEQIAETPASVPKLSIAA